ncbi:unnamed protein product, partial [Sphacelaria rigidula]
LPPGENLQAFCKDCAYLKGIWNGIYSLLTVEDADNKVVIVCLVVAHKENQEMYRYMIHNAKRNPEMSAWLNKRSTTYFVDGHKGSEAGVPPAVPLAEQGRCVRHLANNITPALGSTNFGHIFNAARAPTEASSTYLLDKVKADKPQAYEKWMRIDPTLWAYHTRRDNRVWDQITTNMVESCNNMIGAVLRERPVFDFTKGVMEMVAEKLHEAAQLKKGTRQVFTPWLEEVRDRELSWSKRLLVKTSSEGKYTVAMKTN